MARSEVRLTLTGAGAGPDVDGVFANGSTNNLIGDGSTTGLTNGTNGNGRFWNRMRHRVNELFKEIF